MDWIAELEGGATLVTASDRLSRHLHQQYSDHQLQAGKTAWARPDILPVTAFWRRLFDALHEDGALQERLLDALPTTAWWEQAVTASFADRPLLQAAGAARTALDAWQLAHAWQLDTTRLATDFLDEARLLHQWGTRFEQACDERGWIPEYRLPDHVLDIVAAMEPRRREHLLPRRLWLAGFIEFTPRQQSRWQALSGLGVEVAPVAAPVTAPSRRGTAQRLACADTRDEHRRIAAWAARQLENNPAARIGIVVPDLAGARAALRRQLLETLAPGHVPKQEDAALPFNFSLGEPLVEQPLVRTAIDWLSVLDADAIEFPVAARLGRSPYLAPSEEFPARFALEQVLRKQGYAECSLRDWAFVARQQECPEFANAIDTAREAFLAERRNGNRLPSEWARAASRWLETARWCHSSARTLDSDEYQARDAFLELLGRLATLDETLGKTGFPAVLGWLRRMANETLFQPRAAAAPVQVLGLFEATGMSFDALWIAGLDDGTLPAAPHPNPFLPLALQRESGLPQSSAVREQAFAAQLFDGLLDAAPEVICSHAVLDGDAEQRMSPLLEALPLLTDNDAVETRPGLAENWLATAPLESIDDTRAPAFPDPDGRGGTGLLQDQSACPFRAFAIHRLHADDWPTPVPGPDALIRGSVVHAVLEQLWRRWQDRAELQRRHAAGELENDIREVVDAVVADSVRKHRHRWRDSLASIERERLLAGIRRWVEQVELERPDFAVIEIEGTSPDQPPAEDYREGLTAVQAGPLRLRGKLDRVDRLTSGLPDGSELVIDYKTGSAPSPGHFFGARPQAPQLPAYVIARRQAGRPLPAGIAVASLQAGAESMRGVMRTEDPEARYSGINGITPIGRNRGITDWDQAVAEWETMLVRLGEEFVSGHAAVDPLPRACDYCHLETLCRIHECRDVDADEDEELAE